MVSKFRAEMTSPVPRNTRSKMALQEQKSKDINSGIFTNTSGCISENLHLEWSRIYSIFDNDHFSTIAHDHVTYIRIRSSQLYIISTRPPFMPYTNLMKWELNHANPKDHVFKEHIGTFLAVLNPNIFSKA